MPQTPPPFVKKTFELVSDDTTNAIVSWSAEGDSFIIYQPHILQTEILPKYFKHNNLCSFVRQLNTYDFRKIVDASDNNKTEELEFKNEYFKRNEPDLLRNISRKKPGKRTATQRDVSEILGNNINSPDPLRNLSNEEINALASNCLGQPPNSVEDLRRLMTDNSAMITAIVTLSEKQQQAENLLLTVTKELAEAKKLISSLKQERSLPISPIPDFSNSPMQLPVTNSSICTGIASPSENLQIHKQNGFLNSDLSPQLQPQLQTQLQPQPRWNTPNHNATIPPNIISQPFSITTPMVSIPSRTEVAAVAQERKQQALKREPEQAISKWTVSVSPVNSIK